MLWDNADKNKGQTCEEHINKQIQFLGTMSHCTQTKLDIWKFHESNGAALAEHCWFMSKLHFWILIDKTMIVEWKYKTIDPKSVIYVIKNIPFVNGKSFLKMHSGRGSIVC